MKEFLSHFKKLDKVHRNLIYFMWTYFLGFNSGNIFINIYIYNYFWNIEWLITYNLIFYTFCFLAFATSWLFLSNLKISFKWSFIIWIFSFILSVLTLFVFETWNNITLYLYSVLNWIWLWMFWCWVHTYELWYIEVGKRDFYSSSSFMGKTIITIGFPLIWSLIFYLVGESFTFISYTILFVILILAYLSSFLFLRNLPDYYAKKVRIKNILNKFDRREIFQNLFFLFDSISNSLIIILNPIIVIFLLKTEVNVWIFEWIIWVISVLVMWLLSTKRNEKNRLKIMLYFSLLMFISLILFGFYISVIWLVVFKLLVLIFKPGVDISIKVFNMKYMWDLEKENNQFLSKVIYRELIIAIWRILILIPLLLVVRFSGLDTTLIIRYFLIICWISYLLTWLFVWLEERKRRM
jgi:hypothetical protein